MRVIARGYGDRPLDRVVVGRAQRVIYVASEEVARHLSDDPMAGVGFPADCIFAFESHLFEKLERAWRAAETRVLADLWVQATQVSREALLEA